jgi:hypothetical protein
MISKSVTQSNVKDLVERQDRLEVMMEALMGKIDKLSIKMISRHDVSSCKVKKVKRFIRRAFFSFK